MKVAIIGVGHWHVGLYYLPALQKLGADIVAISDSSQEALERIGSQVVAARYRDYRELLDSEKVDLVMAHAPHSEMTELAAQLVARHQPFHMEKPMGIDWRRLEPVAAKAETEGIFTSVALISRYLGVVEKLAELKEAGQLGRVYHYCYRLLAGGPQRYLDWHCPWMLDPDIAGGGPLFNFGPHVIDLFNYLSGQAISEVYARRIAGLHDVAIEDMVSITMVCEDGAMGIAEVGYVLPSGYERYLSLTTDTLYMAGDGTCGELQFRDGEQVTVTGPDSDEAYFRYTADVLESLVAGRPPRATIQDMVQALRVINAADLSARRGVAVRLDSIEN